MFSNIRLALLAVVLATVATAGCKSTKSSCGCAQAETTTAAKM